MWSKYLCGHGCVARLRGRISLTFEGHGTYVFLWSRDTGTNIIYMKDGNIQQKSLWNLNWMVFSLKDVVIAYICIHLNISKAQDLFTKKLYIKSRNFEFSYVYSKACNILEIWSWHYRYKYTNILSLWIVDIKDLKN